jgi:hypothetical protein
VAGCALAHSQGKVSETFPALVRRIIQVAAGQSRRGAAAFICHHSLSQTTHCSMNRHWMGMWRTWITRAATDQISRLITEPPPGICSFPASVVIQRMQVVHRYPSHWSDSNLRSPKDSVASIHPSLSASCQLWACRL